MKSEYRVSYADTDQMGVVYYGNYFVFFERSRTEMLRAVGLPYRELEAMGCLLAVRHAECTYLAPARYDDLLTLESKVTSLKGVTLVLETTVWRDTEKLAVGTVELVCISPAGRPARFPDNLRIACESLMQDS